MTIVLGYVPSDAGRAALAAAVDETRRRGSDLVVVNTTRADRLVDPRYAQEDELTDLADTLESSGVEFEIRHYASEGLAAEEVIDVAREVDAELIVIGLRRRTPVGKLILGSAAQSILLDAPYPVLAIKAP